MHISSNLTKLLIIEISVISIKVVKKLAKVNASTDLDSGFNDISKCVL